MRAGSFILALVVLLLGGSEVGQAQLMTTFAGPAGVPGGGPPPVCSNTLDFSDGCNSQYIPGVL